MERNSSKAKNSNSAREKARKSSARCSNARNSRK